MTELEALRIERQILAALVATTAKDRPEIVGRLRLLTTQLLKLELAPAPLRAVPEHEELEGHELRYFQK